MLVALAGMNDSVAMAGLATPAPNASKSGKK
jgi:hypothetical protein